MLSGEQTGRKRRTKDTGVWGLPGPGLELEGKPGDHTRNALKDTDDPEQFRMLL